MSNDLNTNRLIKSPFIWTGIALCLSFIAATPRAAADVVIIESRSGGQNYGEYNDSAFGNSSLKSSAPGCTAGIGCRYSTQGSATVTLNPSVAITGGAYELDHTHGAASSTSVDIMVNIVVTGGVFTNIPGAGTGTTNSIWTTAFQGTGTNANVFKDIGNVQLNPGTSSFTLFFSTTNTDISGTARFVSDAYRLTYTGEPCLQGLGELYAIDGSLYAGQTNVTVPGVSASATNVNVYTNGILAGHLSTGVIAGVNVVPTGSLVKGSFVTATQTGTNGVESCYNTVGSEVGGGPNPQIRVSLSLETDPNLTGPIGATGTSTSGNYFFLDATGDTGLGGFGTAPAGGQVVYPSTNWQTLTFNPGDSGYYWAGTYAFGETMEPANFAQLDAIAFCIDDLSDTGPFILYVDDLMNGTNVVQNFESVPAGTIASQFQAPGYSSTTSGNLLALPPGTIIPNISQVTSVLSPTGTNSCMVSWQFETTNAAGWVRLSASSTAGGTTASPQLDVTQPISFNILLEPVGISAPVPPTVTVTSPKLLTGITNSILTLSWTGTFYLQSTPALRQTVWTDVGVSNSPYSIPATNKAMFYRLSLKP